MSPLIQLQFDLYRQPALNLTTQEKFKIFPVLLHFSPHIVYKTVSITSASRSHVIIEKKDCVPAF